jgi:ubiquinone/menaquinone biosynthesis C-methylase UbiE
MQDVKRSFAGSIPEYYNNCLGPAWFDKFAADLAARLPTTLPGDVLELACGTGLVTGRLRQRLEGSLRLVATDLSPAMIEFARRSVDAEGITWKEADASDLPFDDASFGAVVCSFGLMFVPARRKVFHEARRVLKPGGSFLFNVWDRIEENPCALIQSQLVASMFPGDDEIQLTLPYEMHDERMLRELLVAHDFEPLRLEKVRHPVEGVSARTIATGQIRGSPRGALLAKRGITMEEAIEAGTRALEKYGGDPFRAHAQAVFVEARAL